MESNEQNQAFLDALKQENERLLEEHMRKLELQFDEKLNIMLARLEKSQARVSPKSSSKRIPDSVSASTNNAFFAAAQHNETAPKLNIYEGNVRTAVIHARVEANDNIQPTVLSTRDGTIKQDTQESKISPSPILTARKLPSQLAVYAEPVGPPISQPTRTPKKKSPIQQPSDESSTTPIKVYKLDSCTRSALSKSQHLIQETQSLTKRNKKKPKTAHEPLSSDESTSQPRQRPATTLPQVAPPMMRTVTFSNTSDVEPVRRMHAVASAPDLRRKRSQGETFPPLTIEDAIDVPDEDAEPQPRTSKFVHASDTAKPVLDNRAWENDIARHILSIYASTKMRDDPKASSAVLEFVSSDAASSQSLLEEGILRRQSAEINFSKTPRGSGKRKSARKVSQSSLDAPLNAGISGLPKSKHINRKEREVVKTTLRTTQTPRIVRAPPKCFPIWFVSSGEDIYAEWLTLPGHEKLQGHLDNLREKRQYKEYVDIVESILNTLLVNVLYREEKERERIAKAQATVYTGSPKAATKRGTDAMSVVSQDTSVAGDENELSKEEIAVLWRQLVLVCNAFAILYLESKQMDLCMKLVQLAESWCSRDDIFPSDMRAELKSYVHNTMAYYFYRKKLTRATLNHTKQAMMYYQKMQQHEYVALCLLHQACGEYQMSNFKGAMQTLYSILEMVEDGQLAFEETEPKQLCMIAIAYHNLAVVQLKLRSPDAACKSSQNARKIARLCLSHSNRWLNTFHWTHQLALEGVKYELSTNPNLTPKQVATLNELTEMMFDPTPT